MSSVMSLQDENRVLQGELARLEDMLAHSRADRDELAIKYGAISERVSRDVIGNRLSTVNVVDVNQSSCVKEAADALQSFLLFSPNLFLLSCLCLECAGLPGDGGWYEVKCDVAMASVTRGDCKQGGCTGDCGSWVGGRRISLMVSTICRD